MRACFVIVFILSLSFYSFSQIRVINESLTKPDTAMLYLEVENVLKIEGSDSSDVQIKSKNFEILKYGDEKNTFTAFSQFADDETTDTFYIGNEKEGYTTKAFQVKTINDPVAIVGSITKNKASVQEVISNPVLNVYIPDCLYKANCHIHSFRVLEIDNSDTMYMYDKNVEPEYDSILTEDPITL